MKGTVITEKFDPVKKGRRKSSGTNDHCHTKISVLVHMLQQCMGESVFTVTVALSCGESPVILCPQRVL